MAKVMVGHVTNCQVTYSCSNLIIIIYMIPFGNIEIFIPV